MRLVLLVIVFIASSGCYPHRGQPVNASSKELLEFASEACGRNDARATRTLLKRLIQTYPESDEAAKATKFTDSNEPGCEMFKDTGPPADSSSSN